MTKTSNFAQFIKNTAAIQQKSIKWLMYTVGCDNEDLPDAKYWFEKAKALEALIDNGLKKLEPELEKAGFNSDNLYYGRYFGSCKTPETRKAVEIVIGIWYNGDGDIADYFRYNPIDIKGIDKITRVIEKKTTAKPEPIKTESDMLDKRGIKIDVGDTVAFAMPDVGGKGYYIEIGIVQSFHGTTMVNIEYSESPTKIVRKTSQKVIIIKTNKSKTLGF